MRFVVSVIAGVLIAPLFVVWAGIIAILLRPFGIRFPLLIWRPGYGQAVQRLNRWEFIIIWGTVFFGAGLFSITEILHYFESTLGFRNPVSSDEWVPNLITSLGTGILFGWMAWKYGPRGKPLGAQFDDLSINPNRRE